jgi:ACT domain-containing protein
MSRRFLTAEDVRRSGGTEIIVDAETLVTPQASEVAQSMGIAIRTPSGAYTEPEPDRGPDAQAQALHLAALPEPLDEGLEGGVIVTAVGCNRPGVLGEIAAEVGQHHASIKDVSQKTIDSYFHLVLVVEMGGTSQFNKLKEGLEDLGRQNDYVVRVMHERVFRYMHRV